MTLSRPVWSLFLVVFSLSIFGTIANAQVKPGRDPNQPIDQEYTNKIREYTTAPYFNSPLTDYLPASPGVPTPKAVLGDVAGAPGKLPYAEDVYKYMRMLERASPRVKVFSIGTTEEGREMIAVAIASEQLISKIDENRARLAKLADPRSINMDEAEADRLVAASFPVYYITGTIHSPETGSPTALMELAYRLVVDNSPYVKSIRDSLVTLITPVVEVDGRNRMVDVYNWHLAHPNQNWPGLLYWGHYVAHDNNRDAIGLSLKLTRNVMNTYLSWKPQVIHDLHESVPYLYDNTIGDGPYNAWVDPILTDEWQMICWNNVSEMTKFGMPGVFAHGNFDTWSPGYLMFIAATHNGISRLYETFGNAGADTVERSLSPSEYQRTWYRQNPPLPKAKWSQRNNNNYQQNELLTSLHYFGNNSKLFLKNFYLKSKRSIEKPKSEGPAAYVLPGDDPRSGNQADLLRTLQAQGVELSKATAPFTVAVRRKAGSGGSGPARSSASPAASPTPVPKTEDRTFPAGSYIVRMDQPYSRIADALLDYQYWAPNDPQTRPYDDTGWTFPEGFGVQAVRVLDQKVLDVAMERVAGEVKAPSGVSGTGTVFAINHNADNALITLRYKLKNADIQVAEEPFDANGTKFNRGTFIIKNVAQGDLDKAANEVGLKAVGLAAAPSVKTHAARAARLALLHTWTSTQTEGWWRQAFDTYGIPYDYIDPQTIRDTPDLRAKWDVILFGPGGTQGVVEGQPMWRTPIPYKNTPETPNLVTFAQTDDTRIGMGLEGVMKLRKFIADGGVYLGADTSADFAISNNFSYGVSTLTPGTTTRVVGSLLRSKIVDEASPIVYGVPDNLAVYSESGDAFTVSSTVGGGGRGAGGGGGAAAGGGRGGGAGGRPTGRGTPDDPDVVQGLPAHTGSNLTPLPPPVQVQPWQYALPTEEALKRNPVNVIPPEFRPRVALRFDAQNTLLVSGLLDGGNDIAQRPIVVDVPVGKGHVVLFAGNPIWRGETIGSYSMVFNTILNFDSLNAGRKLDPR